MKKILLLSFFSIVLCMSILYARSKEIKVTGIFSNLVYHEESGDLIGNEAIIFYTKKGYFIMFQQSQGEPEIPVIVTAKIENHRITFTLPDSLIGYKGVFKGEIKKDRLVGQFIINGEPKNIELKRGNSYWQ